MDIMGYMTREERHLAAQLIPAMAAAKVTHLAYRCIAWQEDAPIDFTDIYVRDLARMHSIKFGFGRHYSERRVFTGDPMKRIVCAPWYAGAISECNATGKAIGADFTWLDNEIDANNPGKQPWLAAPHTPSFLQQLQDLAKAATAEVGQVDMVIPGGSSNKDRMMWPLALNGRTYIEDVRYPGKTANPPPWLAAMKIATRIGLFGSTDGRAGTPTSQTYTPDTLKAFIAAWDKNMDAKYPEGLYVYTENHQHSPPDDPVKFWQMMKAA